MSAVVPTRPRSTNAALTISRAVDRNSLLETVCAAVLASSHVGCGPLGACRSTQWQCRQDCGEARLHFSSSLQILAVDRIAVNQSAAGSMRREASQCNLDRNEEPPRPVAAPGPSCPTVVSAMLRYHRPTQLVTVWCPTCCTCIALLATQGVQYVSGLSQSTCCYVRHPT